MPTHPSQTPPVVRAGIYTRISWDPEGQRVGVERQRVDCETLCADRGWEIAQYLETPTRRTSHAAPAPRHIADCSDVVIVPT